VPEDTLGRREYDGRLTSDHDILIELRRDVANLIRRVDDQMVEMSRAVSSVRTDHGEVIRDHERRIDSLEKRRDQQDGATGLTRGIMAMAFSAGGLLVGSAGLVLKLTGHL
jgi:hypothetical protein